MIVKLKKQDIDNLNNFLDRVELKGRSEAVALTVITNALNSAQDETSKPMKKKEGEK